MLALRALACVLVTVASALNMPAHVRDVPKAAFETKASVPVADVEKPKEEHTTYNSWGQKRFKAPKEFDPPKTDFDRLTPVNPVKSAYHGIKQLMRDPKTKGAKALIKEFKTAADNEQLVDQLWDERKFVSQMVNNPKKMLHDKLIKGNHPISPLFKDTDKDEEPHRKRQEAARRIASIPAVLDTLNEASKVRNLDKLMKKHDLQKTRSELQDMANQLKDPQHLQDMANHWKDTMKDTIATGAAQGQIKDGSAPESGNEEVQVQRNSEDGKLVKEAIRQLPHPAGMDQAQKEAQEAAAQQTASEAQDPQTASEAQEEIPGGLLGDPAGSKHHQIEEMITKSGIRGALENMPVIKLDLKKSEEEDALEHKAPHMTRVASRSHQGLVLNQRSGVPEHHGLQTELVPDAHGLSGEMARNPNLIGQTLKLLEHEKAKEELPNMNMDVPNVNELLDTWRKIAEEEKAIQSKSYADYEREERQQAKIDEIAAEKLRLNTPLEDDHDHKHKDQKKETYAPGLSWSTKSWLDDLTNEVGKEKEGHKKHKKHKPPASFFQDVRNMLGKSKNVEKVEQNPFGNFWPSPMAPSSPQGDKKRDPAVQEATPDLRQPSAAPQMYKGSREDNDAYERYKALHPEREAHELHHAPVKQQESLIQEEKKVGQTPFGNFWHPDMASMATATSPVSNMLKSAAEDVRTALEPPPAPPKAYKGSKEDNEAYEKYKALHPNREVEELHHTPAPKVSLIQEQKQTPFGNFWNPAMAPAATAPSSVSNMLKSAAEDVRTALQPPPAPPKAYKGSKEDNEAYEKYKALHPNREVEELHHTPAPQVSLIQEEKQADSYWHSQWAKSRQSAVNSQNALLQKWAKEEQMKQQQKKWLEEAVDAADADVEELEVVPDTCKLSRKTGSLVKQKLKSDAYGMAYYGETHVGDQLLSTIFDTGSWDNVVLSTCGEGEKKSESQSSMFGESSCCSATKCPYANYKTEHSGCYTDRQAKDKLQFGSGITWVKSGVDHVSIRSSAGGQKLEVNNFPLRVVTDAEMELFKEDTQLQSIFGVGLGSAEKNMPLHSLRAERFLMCLDVDPMKGGIMWWNDVDRTKDHDWQAMRVKTKADDDWWGQFWTTTTSEWKLGEGKDAMNLGCPNGCGAIFDSGTSLITVPKVITEHLANLMREKHFEDCSDLSKFPPLNFKIDGQSFSLPAEAYVAEAEGEHDLQEEKSTFLALPLLPLTTEDRLKTIDAHAKGQRVKVKACAVLLDEDTFAETTPWGDLIILGMPLMRKYAVQFDTGIDAKVGRKTKAPMVRMAEADAKCNTFGADHHDLWRGRTDATASAARWQGARLLPKFNPAKLRPSSVKKHLAKNSHNVAKSYTDMMKGKKGVPPRVSKAAKASHQHEQKK